VLCGAILSAAMIIDKSKAKKKEANKRQLNVDLRVKMFFEFLDAG